MTSGGESGKHGDGKRTCAVNPAVLDAISAAIDRLRYGAVQLTVHDGKVVQIEVTERSRFF